MLGLPRLSDLATAGWIADRSAVGESGIFGSLSAVADLQATLTPGGTRFGSSGRGVFHGCRISWLGSGRTCPFSIGLNPESRSSRNGLEQSGRGLEARVPSWLEGRMKKPVVS